MLVRRFRRPAGVRGEMKPVRTAALGPRWVDIGANRKARKRSRREKRGRLLRGAATTGGTASRTAILGPWDGR